MAYDLADVTPRGDPVTRSGGKQREVLNQLLQRDHMPRDELRDRRGRSRLAQVVAAAGCVLAAAMMLTGALPWCTTS
jgi:hypothetical protein